MFQNSFIRLGYGEFLNGFQTNNGSLVYFVSTSDGVVKKQLDLSASNIEVTTLSPKYSMNEVLPLTDSLLLGRYGKSVKLIETS